MLTKLKQFREEREEGFTLIELLVVILIIGILSAIAIPAFLNQRKAAVDASIESDVSNAAKAVTNVAAKRIALAPDEISGDDGGSGTLGFISPMNLASGIAPASNGSSIYPDIKVSSGNTVFIKPSKNAKEVGEYCIYGVAKGGDKYASTPVTYDSLAGGLHGTGGACAATIPSDVADLVAGGGKAPVGGGDTNIPIAGEVTNNGNWDNPIEFSLMSEDMDLGEYAVTGKWRVIGEDKIETNLTFKDLSSGYNANRDANLANSKIRVSWSGYANGTFYSGDTTYWQYDEDGNQIGQGGADDYTPSKDMTFTLYAYDSKVKLSDLDQIDISYNLVSPDGSRHN